MQMSNRKKILLVPGFSPHSYCVVERIFIGYVKRITKTSELYCFYTDENSKYVQELRKIPEVNLFCFSSSNPIKRLFALIRIIKRYGINLVVTNFSIDRYIAGDD